MRKLKDTRIQAIVGLLVAGLLLGGGLLIQHTARTADRPTTPTGSNRGAASFEAAVRQVELRGLYAGSVTLVPSGSGDKVEVRNEGTEAGDLKLVTSIKDGRLSVSQTGDCVIVNRETPCGARFTVSVPRSARVTADSPGAMLNLERLRGDIDVGNAAGLMLTGLSGRLKLQSSTCAIKGTGLTSGQANARSLSGPVELTFARAPQLAEVRSDNGDVTLRLPKESSYRVAAEAPNGSRNVTVRTSEADTYQIRALSSTGSVTISN